MTWKDINIKTYNELYKLTSNALMNDNERDLRVAALLNGISYEEILEQPLDKTRKMSAKMDFLCERPKKGKCKKEYKFNGRDYKLLRDMSEMTTAQYIDYTTVMTGKFEENIIPILSIILVPKGHIYNDGYDMEEVREDVSNLNVEEALGICDFFIKKYRRLLKATLLYSSVIIRLQLRKLPKDKRQVLEPLLKEQNQKVRELLSQFGSDWLKRLLK